jgi:hypothetical protein
MLNSLTWLATNVCHSVITSVEPCRPTLIQLSWSLTSTTLSDRKPRCVLLAN